VLTTLNNNENKSTHWIREQYSQELSNSNDQLFGERFFQSIKKDARDENRTLKQILVPASSFTRGTHTQSIPFLKGSSAA